MWYNVVLSEDLKKDKSIEAMKTHVIKKLMM